MRFFRTIVTAFALAGLWSGSAVAAPTGMLYVDYLVREDPSDPESNVTYIFSLGIKAEQTDGDWVGWLIEEVAIVRLDESGLTEAHWIEDSPYVPTSDGLWWLEHADPDRPAAQEFDNTPELSGTATANDPNDDDMEYEVAGKAFTGQSPRYDGRVSALTFSLRLEGYAELEDEGDDEPVEVEEPTDTPAYA